MIEKYGEFLYGENLYGGKELYEGVNYWYLQVAWDGNNYENESPYIIPDSMGWERGRETKLNSSSNGFVEMQPGKFVVKLRNDTGRYDSRNTLSDLYPNVSPGKKIKLDYQLGYSGDRVTTFYGDITNIEPSSDNGIEIVTVTAYDRLAKLQDAEANIQLEESIDLHDAIQAILDDVNWTDGSSIEESFDTIDYWWVDQQNAASAIYELSFSELGEFFIAGDGTATFYSRHHSSVTPIEFTGGDIKSIDTRQPWEVIKDITRLIIHPRVLRATSTIWTLQGTLYVPAGESKSIWATYTYDNRFVPAINVLCQQTTDYTANTLEGGGGSDITSDFTVSLTSFGKTAKLVVSNANASGGYLTVKVRGDAIDAPDPVTVESAGGTGSAVFTAEMMWQQDVNIALDLVLFLGEQLAQDSFYPIITIETDNETQLGLELFDTIALTVDDRNIDETFIIGKIRHDVFGGGGGIVLTTLWLEPPISQLENYWSFPTLMGETSYFSY